MPEDYDKETKELLKGARDSMLAAASIYRSLDIEFRVEIFVVVSVIGWRYLLHAYYQHKGIDYRYYELAGGLKRYKRYKKTKDGSYKYWGLGECLDSEKCPKIEKTTVDNLKNLMRIRNDIEHWKTDKIDESLFPKLEHCFDRFNRYISDLFGPEYKLDVSINAIPASPSTKQRGDSWREINPYADKVMNKFTMDFANGSQKDAQASPASTGRVMVPYPATKERKSQKKKGRSSGT